MQPSLLLAATAAVFAFAPIATAQTLLPPPPTPAGNPTTANKALLGKALFWDEQLSSSRTMACGTCHIFGHGGTDPRSANPTHPGADGLFGTPDDIRGSRGVVRQDAAGNNVGAPLFSVRPQSTGRRAPSVINAAYESQLFWDGRAGSAFHDPVSGSVTLPAYAALESQAAGPPQSDVEMSHIGRTWTDIAADLVNLTPLALADNLPANLQAFVAGQTYAQLFQLVYGSPGVTPERIVFAIAAYERTLISDQSPYDLFLAGLGTLDAHQSAGFAVFVNHCISCHSDLITLSQPGINDFRDIGVRPAAEDQGRFGATGNPADNGLFKVPGLRNVALRAPYMHNGGLTSLNAVIAFYNRGGDFGPNIDPLVSAIAGQLTPNDQANLISFLNSLTDPRVQLEQAPFDRPRLWSEGPRAPTVLGYGTAGTGGFVPQVVAAAPAYAGNGKFAIGLDRALPGTWTLLALDFALLPAPISVLGQNVYLALTPDLLFFAPGLVQGTNPGEGYASQRLAIPPVPAFIGVPLDGMWLIGDPSGPFGMTSTNTFATAIF